MYTMLLENINIDKSDIKGSIYIEITLNDGKYYSSLSIPSDIEQMINQALVRYHAEISGSSPDANGFILSLRNTTTRVNLNTVIDKNMLNDLNEKVKKSLKEKDNTINSK